MLDYWRFPKERNSWGGEFNGQLRRIELFNAIMRDAVPVAIVETGTFRGTTTLYLARTRLPVYTVEQNWRNFGFSRMQLRCCANVTMIKEDSRAGLRAILDGPLLSNLKSPIFFYLDAHWEEDLPLLGEIEIIVGRAARPIIMIDDFQVPGDPGYGFDNYGSSGVLSQNYLKPALRDRDIAVLYPAIPSSEESGARRGCCVLCRRVEAELLMGSGLVREMRSG